MSTQVKVSVLLTTYNHEKWIAQAIESVLAQKANFDFEIVIMEDCSTDSTRDIVIDFHRRYPMQIRLILAEKNQNDNTLFITAWRTSPAQYVALLDGDDYWSSPYKLQKQVQFMDSHPDYAICYHDVRVLYEDGSQGPVDPDRFGAEKDTSTIKDLLKECYIQGCSPVLRKALLTGFPDWFHMEGNSADWALYLLLAQHGKIRYIDEPMGVYRIHNGGIWSGLNDIQQLERVLDFYKNINRNLDYKYNKIIRLMILRSTASKLYKRFIGGLRRRIEAYKPT